MSDAKKKFTENFTFDTSTLPEDERDATVKVSGADLWNDEWTLLMLFFGHFELEHLPLIRALRLFVWVLFSVMEVHHQAVFLLFLQMHQKCVQKAIFHSELNPSATSSDAFFMQISNHLSIKFPSFYALHIHDSQFAFNDAANWTINRENVKILSVAPQICCFFCTARTTTYPISAQIGWREMHTQWTSPIWHQSIVNNSNFISIMKR